MTWWDVMRAWAIRQQQQTVAPSNASREPRELRPEPGHTQSGETTERAQTGRWRLGAGEQRR